jgi:hypothetical protein
MQAAEIQRLNEQVARFASLHTSLAATVSEQLGPDLGHLTELVSALREDTAEQLAIHTAQLRQLTTAVEEETNPPVNWPALDADTAAEEWEKLGRWIGEILVPWYGITRIQLPDCWALHREMVVELSWLRSAHIDSYRPSAAPDRAGTWHTRWRPSVLIRLREIAPESLCPPGRHLVTEAERAGRDEQDDEPDYGAAPSARQSLPHEQLADSRHWRHFYEQAVEADLAWRTERAHHVPPPAP